MDRLIFSQSRPEFIFNKRTPHIVSVSLHVGACIVFTVLRAKPEAWQIGHDPAKKFHQAATRGFTGFEDEGKRISGDVLVIVVVASLDDVAE